MSTKGTSPWKMLYIQRSAKVGEPQSMTEIALGDKRIQLRADATTFHLWVNEREDPDGPYVAELMLIGARPVSISESDVTYEGFLPEGGPFGNADGSQTVRRTTITLTRD